MSHPRPFVSSGIRLDRILDVLILLGLAASWLGLAGGWHWMLDLTSHFRWQYLAVSLVAVIWTLWRKRRMALAASLLTLVLNAWLIGELVLDSVVTSASAGARLRVISLNVLTSNPDKDVVLRFLREENADVIFLMEVNEEWVRQLEPLKETHPHSLVEPSSDNFGVALYSRVPLVDSQLLALGEWGLHCIEARLRHDDRDLVILGLHPIPPIGPVRADERDRYLSEAASHVEDSKTPALVVGDINATPWSTGARLLMRKGRLRLAPDSWKPTWRAGSISALPIDHAFCSQPLVILNKQIGPGLGSDHRPIVLELAWGVSEDKRTRSN